MISILDEYAKKKLQPFLVYLNQTPVSELLNDYTIKDADAGFDDPSVLEDDNSGSAAPASDEVDF